MLEANTIEPCHPDTVPQKIEELKYHNKKIFAHPLTFGKILTCGIINSMSQFCIPQLHILVIGVNLE